MRRILLLLCLLTPLVFSFLLIDRNKRVKGEPPFEQTPDISYGRPGQQGRVMEVFAPQENANGVGILWLVSGAWYSSRDVISVEISRQMIQTLVGRGYTVFAVVHRSQPKFNIQQMLPDLQRATRYVRFNAAKYHIDPNHIGLVGASSGGHLALLLATTGDDGNPLAKDAVDRVSSRVQAVGCFFPPTDFLNYGKPGENGLGAGLLKGYAAAFDFHEPNPQKRREIGQQISPVNHVTADDPPTLMIHGDSDPLVPAQQSKLMLAQLQKAHVPAQLVLKPGAGHGWEQIDKDMPKIADWFDKYLLKKQ